MQISNLITKNSITEQKGLERRTAGQSSYSPLEAGLEVLWGPAEPSQHVRVILQRDAVCLAEVRQGRHACFRRL